MDNEAHRESLMFTELVNISELRELCESFTAITGAVTAILDLEGNILVAAGWQDICTRFHRVHITTACRCRESDTTLAGQLKKGEGYNVYKCKNGLVDVAVPITIDGEHAANFFTGQFFFERSDKKYFIRQAEEFGFDKTDYLAALSRVPIFSETQVRTMMDFLSRLARLIGEMGLARKSLEVRVEQRTADIRNANEQLQREISERKKAEAALRMDEYFLSASLKLAHLGYWEYDVASDLYTFNDPFYAIFHTNVEREGGYTMSPAQYVQRFVHPDDASVIANENEKEAEASDPSFSRELEHRIVFNDGGVGYISVFYFIVKDDQGRTIKLYGVNQDITERKMADQTLRENETKFRTLFESANDSISIVNQNIFIDCNKKTLEMFGCTREQIIGQTPYRFSPEVQHDGRNSLEKGQEKINAAMRGQSQFFEWKHCRYDGTLFDAEVSLNVFSAAGKNYLQSTVRDITERKQAEEKLKFTNVLLSTTQETSIDGILVVDENARILSVNGRFVEMWGIPAKLVEEKVDEPILQFTAIQVVDPKSSIQKIQYLYDHREETSWDELPLVDGRVFDRYSAPMFGSDNQYYGRVWYFRDITERKQAEEQIQHLATHDSLTGLPNRAMFSQQLNRAIQSARRYERQFAVFFIDLDRFKIINDTLGHEAGDQLLQEIAMRLKQALRSADIVARLGGDEFVLLVDEANDLSQVATVAYKILSVAGKPMVLMGEECRVTASIGISIYPKDAEDEQSLMKTADIAMYLAKEKGKNNYQFYSKEIQSKSIERQSIETNLRFALERHEFFLHYQARLDFKTGAITGVEALLRWQSPYLGSMTPTQFIPVAEETGLIVPIGRWVLKTACAQNVAWQEQGLAPVCMAVNVSLKQLTDDNLLDDISTALKDSGMAPNLLELEITENMLMHNPERVIAKLTKIKDMGVRLAIDNFGTGYSSLAQIKGLPIDMIKVDRSFIHNLLQNTENKTITEAIIAMGKTLSLTVVAEGVETQEQMDFLREHACDEMYGFFFNRPATPDQFADLLRNHVSALQK